MEVLAGLALSTQDYVDLMIFKDGQPSAFYQSYVRDIQEKITENAAAEFTCIWREFQRCGGAKPRTVISDELSSTLNNLQAELENSDLYDDVPSRHGVMRRAIPNPCSGPSAWSVFRIMRSSVPCSTFDFLLSILPFPPRPDPRRLPMDYPKEHSIAPMQYP